jgi:hypothetical protein
METITKTYKVYNFEELKPEIQEKVIQELYDINIFFDWYKDDDIYFEIAKDYGLEINMDEINFSIDRENYAAFETYNHSQKENYYPGIRINDFKTFVKKAGLRMNKRLRECYIKVEHKHYAGGIIDNYLDIEGDLKEEEEQRLEQSLDNFLDEVLTQLKNDYNYLTSREAIIETIECNNYTFLANGKMFNE